MSVLAIRCHMWQLLHIVNFVLGQRFRDKICTEMCMSIASRIFEAGLLYMYTNTPIQASQWVPEVVGNKCIIADGTSISINTLNMTVAKIVTSILYLHITDCIQTSIATLLFMGRIQPCRYGVNKSCSYVHVQQIHSQKICIKNN